MGVNKQKMKRISLITLLTLLPLSLAAAQQPETKPPKAQIMIVGVAHLVARADLHNATWGEDALSPHMQAQIKTITDRLATFGPTKVMVEGDATNPVFAERYKAYLAGTYPLGANEIYQLGFRLAAMAHNTTIYPIDPHGSFPFAYDSVKASAAVHGQVALLNAADASDKPDRDKQNAFESHGALLDLLRYLNSPESLRANAAWYMYIDRIGDASDDDAGASLVSFWYARNLHMFANIMHSVVPGDRVVVFVGAGHAARLRPLVELSPDLRLVDPDRYLR